MKNILLTLACLLSLTAAVARPHFNFTRIGEAQGLSNGAVYAILRDTRGFVWFGTSSGLDRYDGYSIFSYRHQVTDSLSLPGSAVYDIQELPDGNLFVFTDQGWSIFDRLSGKFEPGARRYMRRIGSRLLTPSLVYADSHQRMWIFVNGEGLWRVQPNGRNADCLFLDGEVLPEGVASSIVESDEGILMIYDTGEIFCIDELDMTVKWSVRYEGELPWGYHPFKSYVDRSGLYWIYSSKGVVVYDLKEKQWRPDVAEPWADPSKVIVHGIGEGLGGRVWIGTDADGVHLFEKKTGEITVLNHNPADQTSIAHNSVYSLHLDREGVMWCGTYKNGVSCCLTKPTGHLMFQVNDVTTLVQSDDEHVWLGTNGNGIIRWNLTHNEAMPFEQGGVTGVNPIVGLCQTRDGSLWAGTYMGGLYRIRPDGKVDRWTASHDEDRKGATVAVDNIWSMIEDESGNLWISTLGGGIQYLNVETGKFLTYDLEKTDLGDNTIRSVALSPDGRSLAIGSSGHGVAIMDLTTYTVSMLAVDHVLPKGFANPGALPPTLQGVNQLMYDSRGLLWIASSGGLGVYEPEHHCITVFDDTSMEALSITEDKNRDIWVTTQRDVKHIHPKAMLGQRNYVPSSWDHAISVYGKGDGVRTGEFNQRSMITLNDGRIIAGGISGIDVFDVERMVPDSIAPTVFFSGVRLMDTHLPEDVNELRDISFDYGQKMMIVYVAADRYAKPGKNRFAYKLDGFNTGWISIPTGSHSLTFTNLDPGDYTLHIKALSEVGQHSSGEQEMKIHVIPPVWATWWAKTIYGLAGLALLALLWWWSLRLAKGPAQPVTAAAKKQQIDEEEWEEHRKQMRLYTEVAREMPTPLARVIATTEQMLETEDAPMRIRNLNVIHHSASRLLTLVNRMTGDRDSDVGRKTFTPTEQDFVAFLRSAGEPFSALAQQVNIQFAFYPAVETLPMAFDADKMKQAFDILLNNAFKFTPDGGSVTVTMDLVQAADTDEELPDQVVIGVADTGPGIPKTERGKIFARYGHTAASGSSLSLSTVHDYITMHDGDIKALDNEDRQGTVFVIQLPIRHIEAPAPAAESPDAEPASAEPSEATPEPETAPDPEMAPVLEFRPHADASPQPEATPGPDPEEQAPAPGETEAELAEEPETPEVTPVEEPGAPAEEPEMPEETSVEEPEAPAEEPEAPEERPEEAPEEGIPEQEPAPSEPALRDDAFVQKVSQYIEENISRSDLTVEDLASVMGISRVALYNRLTSSTGRSPLEFIRLLRIQRAARYLKDDPQMYIAEIAYAVGFNNPKIFSRYFKAEFGMTPSEYQAHTEQ